MSAPTKVEDDILGPIGELNVTCDILAINVDGDVCFTAMLTLEVIGVVAAILIWYVLSKKNVIKTRSS